MINIVKGIIGNYISLKIIFSLLGLFLAIPLLGTLYWAFDSSYLAVFGVGPEIYGRPMFSSKLINTWLVVVALKPGIWIWTALGVLLFILLTYVSYIKNSINKPKIDGPKSELSEHVFVQTINAADQAKNPAIIFLLVGLLFILGVLAPMAFLSKQAKLLAKNQINAYVTNGECNDTFDDSNIGCYTVPGEEGNDKLIVYNDDHKIIFMSTEKPEDADCYKKDTKIFYVNVKDKATGDKISRLFKTK